jgi:hypothetical protein
LFIHGDVDLYFDSSLFLQGISPTITAYARRGPGAMPIVHSAAEGIRAITHMQAVIDLRTRWALENLAYQVYQIREITLGLLAVADVVASVGDLAANMAARPVAATAQQIASIAAARARLIPLTQGDL